MGIKIDWAMFALVTAFSSDAVQNLFEATSANVKCAQRHCKWISTSPWDEPKNVNMTAHDLAAQGVCAKPQGKGTYSNCVVKSKVGWIKPMNLKIEDGVDLFH